MILEGPWINPSPFLDNTGRAGVISRAKEVASELSDRLPFVDFLRMARYSKVGDCQDLQVSDCIA